MTWTDTRKASRKTSWTSILASKRQRIERCHCVGLIFGSLMAGSGRSASLLRKIAQAAVVAILTPIYGAGALEAFREDH